MDLSQAVSELYGGAPEDFVETRKRLAAEAKKAGDAGLAKSIGALRRPTVSAWAVNRLARDAPDELDELLDLGADLRAAWGKGGQIGELDQRRGELVARLARTVDALAEQAGRPLREGAAREIEDTLHAATMDAAVAEEVRHGRLAQPRRHVGFGPADDLSALLGSSVAGAAPSGTDRRKAGHSAPAGGRAAKGAPAAKGDRAQRAAEAAKAREEAKKREEEERRRRREERAAAAEAQAAQAASALAEWETEAGEAERAHVAATEEADRLRRELAAALERQEAATKRLNMAERERDRATRRAAEARRRAAEARAES
ncbi:hypothetical protein ABZT47_27840 [Sphaerisporangium sp. NPDC005289]|uniref:hypothetical protein n=1 Tax=Sphaerisporangium sp. NPDC005289 TaxID=3155247 RepID=UPI0033A63EC2